MTTFRMLQAAGVTSSLLIFIYFMMGAFSMWLISLEWLDKIRIIGTLESVRVACSWVFGFCYPTIPATENPAADLIKKRRQDASMASTLSTGERFLVRGSLYEPLS